MRSSERQAFLLAIPLEELVERAIRTHRRAEEAEQQAERIARSMLSPLLHPLYRRKAEEARLDACWWAGYALGTALRGAPPAIADA